MTTPAQRAAERIWKRHRTFPDSCSVLKSAKIIEEEYAPLIKQAREAMEAAKLHIEWLGYTPKAKRGVDLEKLNQIVVEDLRTALEGLGK